MSDKITKKQIDNYRKLKKLLVSKDELLVPNHQATEIEKLLKMFFQIQMIQIPLNKVFLL